MTTIHSLIQEFRSDPKVLKDEIHRCILNRAKEILESDSEHNSDLVFLAEKIVSNQQLVWRNNRTGSASMRFTTTAYMFINELFKTPFIKDTYNIEYASASASNIKASHVQPSNSGSKITSTKKYANEITDLTSKTIIAIDKVIKVPYVITHSRIVVFDEETALYLNMYDGNLNILFS